MDPTERRRSLLEYIASLDLLASLPMTRVFPGHRPVIDEPHRLIEEMRAHHRERADALAAMLTDDGRSAWQLANDLFANLEGFDTSWPCPRWLPTSTSWSSRAGPSRCNRTA